MIARLLLVLTLLAPMQAEARCFLFFCSRPRHIHHVHHAHPLRPKVIVRQKVVVVRKDHPRPIDRTPLAPITPPR